VSDAFAPTALQKWWAGLPDVARGFLRRTINPHNLTQVHLAHLTGQRPAQVRVGDFTYGRPKVRFAESGAKLTIGRYGSIADGVEVLLGGNHRTDWVTTYPFPALPGLWPEAAGRVDFSTSRGDITIGHDVWIGSQAMILSGVSIGHGAVIAARSVVTRDVPPYAIVAGNPARLIRLRFDQATIAAVQASAWWDLPRETVARLLPVLMAGDVAAFLRMVPQAKGGSDAA
jgi:virginiamycin A acetyltransferase